jgi:OmpA-OmpF porin, OOP family
LTLGWRNPATQKILERGREMKKLFSAAALATVLGIPVMGFAAAPGMYVSGNIGSAVLNDSTLTEPGISVDAEFDTGLGITAALGYDMGGGRVELEFGYRSNDIDKFSAGGMSVAGGGDVTSTSLMLNGYFDFKSQSQWTPFLGAGLGMAKVDVENVTIGNIVIGDADDTVFAYQFIAGLGYAVTPNTSIDISYRYFATADLDLEGTDAEYDSHNFMIGARFSF